MYNFAVIVCKHKILYKLEFNKVPNNYGFIK